MATADNDCKFGHRGIYDRVYYFHPIFGGSPVIIPPNDEIFNILTFKWTSSSLNFISAELNLFYLVEGKGVLSILLT